MKFVKLIIPLFMGFFLLNACGKKTEDTKPIRKNITETVFASGILVPENLYNLTAQSDGYIKSLTFEEGDLVNTGDLLATIDNRTSDINSQGSLLLLEIAKENVSPSAPIFKQLEANLKAAEQKLKQEKQQAERYKTLYVSNSVSKLEFENAQLAYETANSNYISLSENYKLQKQQSEQQLISQQTQSEVNKVLQGNNDLRAVIGGKIYNKYKELGDYVRRGEVIAVIGDPKNIYARLSIDESSFSKVQLKQQVIIQLNIDKHKNYNGEISEIYPSFDSKSQSFNCKVKFKDSLLFGVSGTQVQANIITNRKDNILVIPRKYLDYGNTVIIKGTGKVKVKTGFISNEWVEIVSGLDEKSIIQVEKE